MDKEIKSFKTKLFFNSYRISIHNLKLSQMMINIQWSFLALVTSSFVHLILRITIGKELGSSRLGLYTLIFTIYMFGMQLSGFGIGSALTKYISEYHDNLSKISEFVSAGILGSMVSGSVMGLILYTLSEVISTQFFHNSEMINLLKITAFCYPFIALQKAVFGAQIGLREIKLYAILNIAQNVSVVAVSIFLVNQLHMNIQGAVIGFVLPTIIMGLFSLIFIKKYIVKNIPNLIIVLKEILFFGFYVALANSIGLINSQLDSLMIGHFINETEVGYYAVATIIIEGLCLIPNAYGSVMDNRIVHLYADKDYEAIIKLTKNIFLQVVVITILESIALIFFGKFLIRILFGANFLPAYQPLLILLIGYTLYDPTLSIVGFLPGIGKVSLSTKIYFLCAVLNTLLNVLLVPKYAMKGAAMSTSLSLIFVTLARLYLTRHYLIQLSRNEAKITS